MGSVFKFKQFEVDQRECAMKINTDGVLLGAVSEYNLPKRILDIGSGTGVISLMLAQRFDKAEVDAVEIDESAYIRTKSNFENSNFSDRLFPFHTSFEFFQNNLSYDLIVSNPPFYTNSLHNPDAKKTLARHTDISFFHKLLSFGVDTLSDDGSLQLILPTDLSKEVSLMAESIGYSIRKIIDIRSFENSEVIRQIIDLRKNEYIELIRDEIIIYESKGVYTSKYKEILSPFFLAF